MRTVDTRRELNTAKLEFIFNAIDLSIANKNRRHVSDVYQDLPKNEKHFYNHILSGNLFELISNSHRTLTKKNLEITRLNKNREILNIKPIKICKFYKNKSKSKLKTKLIFSSYRLTRKKLLRLKLKALAERRATRWSIRKKIYNTARKSLRYSSYFLKYYHSSLKKHRGRFDPIINRIVFRVFLYEIKKKKPRTFRSKKQQNCVLFQSFVPKKYKTLMNKLNFLVQFSNSFLKTKFLLISYLCKFILWHAYINNRHFTLPSSKQFKQNIDRRLFKKHTTIQKMEEQKKMIVRENPNFLIKSSKGENVERFIYLVSSYFYRYGKNASHTLENFEAKVLYTKEMALSGINSLLGMSKSNIKKQQPSNNDTRYKTNKIRKNT